MNRQCETGSTDTEIRRFKNRVRQQRYRARKREEKIKRIVDANRAERNTFLQPNPPRPPPLGPSILCMADRGTAQKTDEMKRNEGNGICSAEAQRFAIFSSGETGNCHKDAESTPAVCGRSILQTDCTSRPFQHGNQSEFHVPKIFQPIYKMEGGYNSSPGDELMTRRLKNRERQRRYRARKRLEADIVRNAQHPGNQPSPLQQQQQQRGGFIWARARRDWKKDARNAHSHKFPHLFPLDDLRVSSALSSGSECHEKQGCRRMPLEMNTCERPRRRRDWKAAARSKAG